MHLDKQWYKNMKTYLNAITTVLLTMLYLHSNKPNAATFYREFLKIQMRSRFCLPASQPINRN